MSDSKRSGVGATIQVAALLGLLLTLGCQSNGQDMLKQFQGSISCVYGNRGGYCEVDKGTVKHRYSISSADKVIWKFEGRELPTVQLDDVDIVLPVFEADALTHFDGCRVLVTETPDAVILAISQEGCIAPLDVYRPLLN